MGETKEKKKKQSFFKGVKKEFKKVSWPTKEQTFKETLAVIVVSVLMGALIVLVDNVALKGVNYITKLGNEEEKTVVVYDGSDSEGLDVDVETIPVSVDADGNADTDVETVSDDATLE